MKQCPYCKKLIEESSPFCEYCNKPLIVNLERFSSGTINPMNQNNYLGYQDYHSSQKIEWLNPLTEVKNTVENEQLNDAIYEIDDQIEQRDALGESYGNLLLKKASIFYKNKDFSNSLKILKHSLHYFKESEDLLNLAIINNEMGLIYEETNFFDDAIYHFERAIKNLKDINEIQKLVHVYNNLANVYFTLNDLEHSYIYYEEALKLAELNNLTLEEIKTSSNLVDVLFLLNQFDKIGRILSRNLDFFRYLNDLNGMIITFIKIGKLNYFMGADYYNQSYNSLNEALTLIDKLKTTQHPSEQSISKMEWECFMYMAKLNTIWNNDREAEDYYKRSIKALRNFSPDGSLNEATVLESFSKFSEIKGSLDKAIMYYNQTHDLYYKFGEDAKCAEMKYRMARLLFGFDADETRAISLFEEALNLYEDLGYEKEIANILHELGDHYLNSGLIDMAITYLERALTYYLEMHDEYNTSLIKEKINSLSE